ICFTRSSTLAILVIPPISAIWNSRPPHMRGWDPQTTCPFYARAYAGSTLADHRPENLTHIQPTIHIEHLSRDVAGFVGREKNYRGGHIAICPEAAQRNQRLHLVFDFL